MNSFKKIIYSVIFTFVTLCILPCFVNAASVQVFGDASQFLEKGNDIAVKFNGYLFTECKVPTGYESILEVQDKGSGSFVIKNINTTNKRYINITVTCTAALNAVSSDEFKYNFSINADKTTANVNNVRYDIFEGEQIDLEKKFFIDEIVSFTPKAGKDYGSITHFGCEVGHSTCYLTFTGALHHHDAKHEYELYYYTSNVLTKAIVEVYEKDSNVTTKAYPGALGFCDFDHAVGDWTYTVTSYGDGKNYTFYETTDKNAKLPSCSSNTANGILYDFKGWTYGYKPGDSLNTKTTCEASSIVAADSVVSPGVNYAPCYELVPMVRLHVQFGTPEIDGTNWSLVQNGGFYYRAIGSNATDDTIELPNITYDGFYEGDSLKYWQNATTGETKNPGESVTFDGSIWVEVKEKTTVDSDASYKTIELNTTRRFGVEGMTNCRVDTAGSTFLSVVYNGDGDCSVTGDAVTPIGVYADVIATVDEGGTSVDKVYKFSVVKGSSGTYATNEYDIDVSDVLEAGKNDSTTLNGFATDMCDTFKVSWNYYSKYKMKFAVSKRSSSVNLNSSIYHVESQCSGDTTNYVSFCLDPGRIGPGETAEHSQIYTKVEDLTYDENDDLSLVLSYIVKNMDIDLFGAYSKESFTAADGTTKCKYLDYEGNVLKISDCSHEDYSHKRVASHIAIRVMAIYNGMSLVPDAADQTFASLYYPYEGLANALKLKKADGNVTLDEAYDILNNGYTDPNPPGITDGMVFDLSNEDQKKVYDYLAKILSEYDGEASTPLEKSTVERTISDSEVVSINGGDGYQITYTGTMLFPAGVTNPTFEECRNDSAYNVECKIIENLVKTETHDDGSASYSYKVAIVAQNGSDVILPESVDQTKDLSFKLTFDGGAIMQRAFIAEAERKELNLQRMLLISLSNPVLYVYFDIMPNSCNFGFLDPDLCTSVDNCDSKFNATLFKSAGCCSYLLDGVKYKYLLDNLCTNMCTTSTLLSTCQYKPDADGTADLYEIKEGAKYDGVNSVDAIGTCVVNVSQMYVNDGGKTLVDFATDPLLSDFLKYDDAGNMRNLASTEFKNNRYCQITCEEDWDFTMDSFGNFVGEKAVAAGTYFQIVSNDMFISATKTCYSTFINYDRFMANLTDISAVLVDNYNDYAEWSHVWTDIENQKNGEAGFDKTTTKTDVGAICVEYQSDCPTNYYWSEEAKTCRQVVNYMGKGSGTNKGDPKCTAKPTDYSSSSTNSDTLADDSSDGPVEYITVGAGTYAYTGYGGNSDSNLCSFVRTYCPGNDEPYGSVSLSGNTCSYLEYSIRDTKSKIPDTCEDCDDVCTGSGDSQTCEEVCTPYSCDYCPSDTVEVDGTCYVSGQAGCKSKYSDDPSVPGNDKYCTRQRSFTASQKTLTMKPDYKTTPLLCKTLGKGYSYTVDTVGDVQSEGGKDALFYNVTQTTEVDLAEKEVGNKETEAFVSEGDRVRNKYPKTYTHKCVVNAPAAIEPKAHGTVTCTGENFPISKETTAMICKDGGFADLAYYSGDLDLTFCKAGQSPDKDTSPSPDSNDYSDLDKAFEYIAGVMQEHAKSTLTTARNTMAEQHNLIYSHTEDLFYCQNFEITNDTDSVTTKRANNPVTKDSIIGRNMNYHQIKTTFDPYITYTYDDMFMDFLDKEGNANILVQFDEKNNEIYQDAYGKDYYDATHGVNGEGKVEVDVVVDGSPIKMNLYRNYKTTSYYNPSTIWTDYYETHVAHNDKVIEEYHDTAPNSKVDSPTKVYKTITICTVGYDITSTTTNIGKDGQIVAFVDGVSEKWVTGSCYEVKVDYKNYHYVKTSLSNSSYYKNKGYWYIRGGDFKAHGSKIDNAIDNYNRIYNPSLKFDSSSDEELTRWSRLGSFNVFPISMGTPRNLYTYTYTFANIGNLVSENKIISGRIMGGHVGGDNSVNVLPVIKGNSRTCFYEVYEEVCLCCGYKMETDDFSNYNEYAVDYVGSTNGVYPYQFSNLSSINNSEGTFNFYSSTVSLGDMNVYSAPGSNWSETAKFVYNGNALPTNKGALLKDKIVENSENVYSYTPEYAFLLTPNTLSSIRNYTEKKGYQVDYNDLIPVCASSVDYNGSCAMGMNCECAAPDPERSEITFQHYMSKFLAGAPGYTDPVNMSDSAINYSVLKSSERNVCVIKESDISTVNLATVMETNKCRWVDFIEEDNGTYRLAFK